MDAILNFRSVRTTALLGVAIAFLIFWSQQVHYSAFAEYTVTKTLIKPIFQVDEDLKLLLNNPQGLETVWLLFMT